MAHTIFKNNAKTTINAAVTATDTSITVLDASLLANPGAGQKAYATLIRVLTGAKEVITYTGNDASATISGVTRDVEVTPDSDGDGTGLTFVAGDKIENRIPAGLLGEALQRQGDNGQGDNDVTGDLFWSDAAGPVILNEAATNTNPTLIPNQAELDTGWGWASDVLVAVLGGAEAWRLSTTQVLASNAAGPSLQNEAASTTNPTLIPNQAEVDTGWGWESDKLHAVLGGADIWELSTTDLRSSATGGPQLAHETASATNPTLVPYADDLDTGVGGDGANEGFLIANGSEIAGWNASGLILGNAGARVTTVLDEDTMATDSATALATQQSIKAYTDTQVATRQASDAELTALSGLTSAANKVPYFTDSETADLLDFLDDDTMAANSATAVVSQQSIVAYVAASSSGVPAGAVIIWTTDTAPSGWLLCDGSAVSRTTYSDLFGEIGTTYGVGDGSTTFNLPDMRGRFPLGQDDMGGTAANVVTATEADSLGGTEGEEDHTLSEDELAAHTHSANSVAIPSGTYAPFSSIYTTSNRTTTSAGSDSAHNNMPPYMTVNYVIKT